VEIGSWIAADRPGAAAKLVGDLFAAVERLAIFPESGRAVPEFERDDRFITEIVRIQLLERVANGQ
jgi:plasmid stabilization system protein ParE